MCAGMGINNDATGIHSGINQDLEAYFGSSCSSSANFYHFP